MPSDCEYETVLYQQLLKPITLETSNEVNAFGVLANLLCSIAPES